MALCTASLTVQTYILFELKVDYALVSVVFFSTVFVYCFHRLVKSARSEENIIRFLFSRNQLELTIPALCSLAALLPILFTFDLTSFFFLLFFGALAIWYSLGFFSINGKLINLRNIPFLKLFVIAFTWSMMTVALPLLNQKLTLDYFLVIIERFAFILAITIPFDIRDMEVDKKEGLKTIPVVLGMEMAKEIAIGLILLFTLIVLITLFIQFHSLLSSMSLIISGLLSILMIYRTDPNRKAYFFNLGMEGMSLIQSILVMAAILS